MASKPNLLVFLPDQQRADTLRCYGGRVHAPNLDKFASESWVFEKAYVTQPICTPSRSSLMTGSWPHANGCTRNFLILDAKWRCLPELIDDADYRCGYIGKWHLGNEHFAQHGFAEWISVENNPRYQKLVSPGRDPNVISDYSKFLFERGLKPRADRDFFDNWFVTHLPLELSKARFLERKACEFLERNKADPFVLVVAFFEPHSPYNGPLNEEHRLDEVDVDPTVDHTFGKEMPLRYRLRQERDRERYGNPPEKYREAKRNYYGLVTLIDRSIGAILAQLDQHGLSENTIVVHSSDHGDMMTAHGLMRKEVMFEESIRVPYLVRLPGQRRGHRVAQPVSHIEFAPTVLDLLGKPAHEQCTGKSHARLLRGEAMPAQNVFVQWSPGKTPKIQKRTKLGRPRDIQRALEESTRAVITPDGWKLCLRDKDLNELYNLRADPYELHNLFGRTEHKEIASKLAGEIHQWQENAGDPIEL
ncbi:MAG TPA: sulfatase-like hydrolase/transferase [Chthoniobacterales bacterium]|nr:sulfatase-like hydrolase/transferase [Chthoniobacterales bacterium]